MSLPLPATTEASGGSTAAKGLVRLPVAALRFPDVAAIDVYCRLPGASEPALLWSREFQLREEHLQELKARDFHLLWATKVDADMAGRRLRELKRQYLVDPRFTPAERFLLLQFSYCGELDALAKMIRSNSYVECCRKLGPDFVAALASGPVNARELFQSRLRGPTAAQRLTTLAGYAITLARGLGWTSADELTELAVGALIHDVGAFRLGDLAAGGGGLWSPDDRARIEEHPQIAYEELLGLKTLTRRQLLMAYQHHERLDGEGYPVGVEGDEIHDWAKLLAVVDRFDALTVGRSSRRSLNLDESLSRLLDDVGGHLDYGITQCWTSLLQSN